MKPLNKSEREIIASRVEFWRQHYSRPPRHFPSPEDQEDRYFQVYFLFRVIMNLTYEASE